MHHPGRVERIAISEGGARPRSSVEELERLRLLCANELVGEVHDRVPVIIASEDIDTWLGELPSDAGELKWLLRPRPAVGMTMWPVSPRMNTPEVDDADNLDPNVIGLYVVTRPIARSSRRRNVPTR